MTLSLAEISLSSIVKSLGDMAASRFTCGGNTSREDIRVNCINKTGIWSEVNLSSEANLQEMIESADIASFGRGNEYSLDPNKFFTSFQLSNTSILENTQQLLVPDILDIRAELYKMNIYTGPAGCFKAHVDTPRGGNVFGSLVVCLPTQFTGGALVARHNGQQVIYNWDKKSGNYIIQWAAFFSDVEHEVLPVTKGYRITLTYNLYHSDQFSHTSIVDAASSPFYTNLKAALDHPHFLPDGGVLGFACQHAYIFEEFDKSKSLSLLLKGSDRTILAAAKSLGLKLEVKPIIVEAKYDGLWRGCPLTQCHIRKNFGFSTEKFHEEGYDIINFPNNLELTDSYHMVSETRRNQATCCCSFSIRQ